MANRKLIKAMEMLNQARKEIAKLKPKAPICDVCDSKMIKHHKVSAEGDETWLEFTTLFFCPDCSEIVNEPDPGHH